MITEKAQNNGLEIARQKRAAAKAAGIPIVRLNPVTRAKADPKSVRKAVNAMCWTCEGEDADPHVSWRIGNCKCEATCPLFAVRPHQKYCGTPWPGSK